MEPNANSAGFVAELRRVVTEFFGVGGFDERQEQTFEILFRLLGHLSRIDGEVSDDERRLAAVVMDEMQVPASLRERALVAYSDDSESKIDLERELGRYMEVFPAGSVHVEKLVERLVRLAHADGRVHEKERAFLEEVTGWLQVSRSVLVFDSQGVWPLPLH